MGKEISSQGPEEKVDLGPSHNNPEDECCVSWCQRACGRATFHFLLCLSDRLSDPAQYVWFNAMENKMTTHLKERIWQERMLSKRMEIMRQNNEPYRMSLAHSLLQCLGRWRHHFKSPLPLVGSGIYSFVYRQFLTWESEGQAGKLPHLCSILIVVYKKARSLGSYLREPHK